MDKLPLIYSIFLNVTNACNLCCKYCFNHPRPEYISYQVAKDAVNFLTSNAEDAGAVPSINFFGGEPMLCWDSIIVPLTNYIRTEYRKPFALSMTTNGTLLNRERLEFMKQANIGLLFSVDGDQETQDLNRPFPDGRGSFPHIEDVIPLILEYYPDMTFRATLTPGTCHLLYHNIEFAQSCGYRHYFTIPNVFEEWNAKARLTTSIELRKYSDYIINAYRNGFAPLWLNPYKDFMLKIQRVNTAVARDECRRSDLCGACAKCGLGSQSFASIDYRGNIYACQELVSREFENDNFYIGNIYGGVRDDLRRTLMNSFHPEEEHGDECATCKLRRICDGGCVANNFMVTGSVDKMPEVYCWWSKLLFEEAIYLCTILGNEENHVFLKDWQSIHDGGYYG